MAASYTIIERSGLRRTVRLSPPIAAGAAGSIHRITCTPGKVAKVYLHEKDRLLYKNKIAAMLERPPTLPPITKDGRSFVQIAWPEASIEDDRGQFCGFVMPEVDMQHAALLENVLQKKTRQVKGLPELYALRVLLAANLAALMAELHGLGHHMVDMKPLNMSFYPSESSMAILDTDGFSIAGSPRFPAEQYSDEYIAPEANGKKPEELGLEQDLFALAVIIFRLLNNGIHPYQGIDAGEYPSNLQERIFAGLYGYGIKPHRNIRPAPASLHERLEDKTRELFDRAFQAKVSRPTAADWRDHLSGLILNKLLVLCAENPKEHAHFSKGCGLCEVEHRISNAHRTAARSQVQMSSSVLSGLVSSRQGPASASNQNTKSTSRATASQAVSAFKSKPTAATSLPWKSIWPLTAFGGGIILVIMFAVFSATGGDDADSSTVSDQKWTLTPPNNRGPFIISPGNEINLRTGPGTDYRVITTLLGNSTFETTGITTDAQGREWWQVRLNDGTNGFLAGWVGVRIAAEPEGDYHDDGMRPNGNVSLTGYKLGDWIAADGNVISEKYSFGRDTKRIYITMNTSTIQQQVPTKSKLTARWYEVDRNHTLLEYSQYIAFSGDQVTTFWMTNPNGWPVGNYSIDVSINGAPVGRAHYSVVASQPVASQVARLDPIDQGRPRKNELTDSGTPRSLEKQEKEIICILPSGDEKRLSRSACRSQGGAIFQ